MKDEVQQSRDAEQEKAQLLKEIEKRSHELDERNNALIAAQHAIKNIEEKVPKQIRSLALKLSYVAPMVHFVGIFAS